MIKMFAVLQHYTRWLHTRWPAGSVERLPSVRSDGSTNVPGLYVVGDLTGIPLLKFSADTGARAVQTIVADAAFQRLRDDKSNPDALDLVIIGAGVSGMAAALEARQADLRFEILEATEPFSTIVNFPAAKPIYTYPTEMVPTGDLQFTATIKESLVSELYAQTLEKGIQPRPLRAECIQRQGRYLEIVIPGESSLIARRVIVAIGRSGNFRKLGAAGEELGHVSNRLHDPKDFCDQDVLVVGGGDSALETAIAIAQCGGRVTLSYRKPDFARPKPDNVERFDRLIADPTADVAVETPTSERVTTSIGGFLGEHRKPGSIQPMMASRIKRITNKDATLVDADGRETTIPADAVFTMIGREAPLDFFRRSGVEITGEMTPRKWVGFAVFGLACFLMYTWKKGASLGQLLDSDPSTLLGTLNISLTDRSFYYSLAYTLCVTIFGIRRIRRRRTPYIKIQTLTLTAIQVVPLFLLPQLILPYLGHNGIFDTGWLHSVADSLFPEAGYGHGREYWRCVGFILAWPLFFANVFTDQPMWAWLIISLVQTFVIIPLLIYRWGKGAYCGWICSCGALAETLGDTHRTKMPHGSLWNRMNMVGQVVLWAAFALLITRLVSWTWPETAFGRAVGGFYQGLYSDWHVWGLQINYQWVVDLMLAGVVGVGCYFWFSGRMWCRFACPLAALMHIYARFSQFRILADKKKCISCNVCTSVCHQGIDVMNFANKGLAMEDPQCVRCSACVQSCPTGVLQFGRVDRKTGAVIARDRVVASLVVLHEGQSAGLS